MRVKFLCNIFVFLFIYVLSNFSCSALVISEFQFDPTDSDTGREWVEIYNDSAETIDLTTFKFFENGENHGISLFNLPDSTEKNLASSEYAVLVQDINKFKADYRNFVGKIFKASFSLSNTGETLALKNSSQNIINSVTYSANLVGGKEGVSVCANVLDNSNNTLYKCTSNTPGVQNIYDPNSGVQTESATSTATTSEPAAETISTNPINFYYRSSWPESEKIYLRAGENKVAMLGQTLLMSPKVLDSSKKEIKNGVQYRWNFGDGYTSEKREGLHAYKFVGEFVASLQVNYAGVEEEDKMYIKVVEPKLGVKIKQKELEIATTTQKELVDVLEVENKNGFEINLGGLVVKNENGKIFTFPEKLSILPGRQIFLPPDLTGFATATEKVELLLPNGKLLAEFVKKERQLPKVATPVLTATSSISVYTLEKFSELEKQKKAPIKLTLVTKTRNINQVRKIAENIKIPVVNREPLPENKIEFKAQNGDLFQKFKSFLWN